MRRVVSGICPKHGYHEGPYCQECDIQGVGEVFYTSKDKLWDNTVTYIDGKAIVTNTKGQFENLLKANGKYQIIKPQDVQIEKRRIEQNQKDKSKKETRETLREVVAWSRKNPRLLEQTRRNLMQSRYS